MKEFRVGIENLSIEEKINLKDNLERFCWSMADEVSSNGTIVAYIVYWDSHEDFFKVNKLPPNCDCSQRS